MRFKKGDRLILKTHGRRIPVEAVSAESGGTVQIKHNDVISSASIYDLEPERVDPGEHGVGQRVRHQQKGDGIVTSVDKDPSQLYSPLTYTVKWDDGGTPEPLVHPNEITSI